MTGVQTCALPILHELSGALIATSMVLAAVFVPVSFLSGITGALYRQFSITIVVSVLLSTVVALTLSPAMCAIILRPNRKKKNIVSVKSIFGWPKEIINTAIYWKKRFGIQGASWPVSEW